MNKITSKKYHYYILNYAFSGTVFGTIDRRVANYNIEVRFPFYDKRIVEFCYSLPPEMKFKNGWSRYILRIAMENILPKDIQWRTNKSDLSPTYKKNLLLEKEKLNKMIYVDNQIIAKYVNLKKIIDTFEKYESSNGNNIFELWLVFLLYFWLNYTKIKI